MRSLPFTSLASIRDTDPQHQLSRRSFLGVSAAGIASAALLPVEHAFAEDRVLVNPVITFVGRLAATIGSTVVADLVSDYVRQRAPSWFTRQIETVNNEMYRGNFIDFTASRVYHKLGRIFYPVIHRDGFNACVAFHDNRRQDPRVPMVEGPTVIGMTWAAEEVARLTSRENARRIFYPTRTLERGTGTFETNYGTPDVYATEGGGRVVMDYRNEGPGRGTVAVLAEGPINQTQWGTHFNRQYSFRYA